MLEFKPGYKVPYEGGKGEKEGGKEKKEERGGGRGREKGGGKKGREI